MDNIILGLLLMQGRTIYQLRERIHKGLNLIYSSSTGSIQAAIKKLLQRGYIQYEELEEGGKRKKIYRITQNGRQHFTQWINSPIEGQSSKNPELAKVYFMGFANPENRIANIRQYIALLKQQAQILDAICEEATQIVVPEEHKEILHYQHMSALYGRDFVRFNIRWFENLLNEMRSGAL